MTNNGSEAMIRVDFLDNDTARTPDGVEHRGNNSLYAAARHLIANGTDPEAKMVAGWLGKPPSFNAVTVGHWANLAYGGEAQEPRPGKWVPHPRAAMPLPLARWRQETAAARMAARVAAAEARKEMADATA